MFRFFLISLVTLLLGNQLTAQISHGGAPLSLTDPQYNIDVPVISLAAPALGAVLSQDVERDADGELLRDALVLTLDLDINSSGRWFDLDDGGRLWRLDVKAAGALSLEFFFNQFSIPQGSSLFIISEEDQSFIGSYTSDNNRVSGLFSTDMVKGDVGRLEYYEAPSAAGQTELSILDIGYRYRDVIGLDEEEDGAVGECQVPIGCGEGDLWQDVAKSVVKIRSRVNGFLYWSTGTLMNTPLNDCRPLILTSMRIGIDDGLQSTLQDIAFYRFYFTPAIDDCAFQFERQWSMSGARRRADSFDDGGLFGSDFMLLELLDGIPAQIDVAYAGWDIREVLTESSGVCLFHPFGTSLGIAAFDSSPESSGWSLADTHWKVSWVETDNGFSVPVSGATGAPLFNADGKVIGTYTGGRSSCSDTDQSSFFGKMDEHWSGNPNAPTQKLAAWLDPDQTGVQTIETNTLGCEVVDDLEDRLAVLDAVIGVYPNPSTGEVTIDWSNADVPLEDIVISDALGRQIVTLRPEGLALSHWTANASGLYFFSFRFEEGLTLKRSIIVLD